MQMCQDSGSLAWGLSGLHRGTLRCNSSTEGGELVVPDDDAVLSRLRIRRVGSQRQIFLHVQNRALVVLRFATQGSEVELAFGPGGKDLQSLRVFQHRLVGVLLFEGIFG